MEINSSSGGFNRPIPVDSEKLTEIFKETLDLDNVVLEETTQADDIDEWDSLTHIMLVVAIEKHFEIRFSSNEIQNWSKLGGMVDTILSKI